MDPVGRHISALLFDHDCVIVPQLGGFLASNEPSRMLPNRMIYPPYRKIAFNVYLRANDGLLANHLVETENISYNSANAILEEFTYECIQSLEQGKKVNIEQVGTLYFDHEKNIQFEAFRNINHRIESFGMEPVQLIPVQHSVREEIRNPVVKPVKTIRPSQPSGQPFISKRGRRLIGVAGVLSVLLWFGTNYYFTGPKKFEASLNPFDSESLAVTQLPKDTASTSIVLNDTESSAISIDSQLQQNDSLLADNVVKTPETATIVVTPEIRTVEKIDSSKLNTPESGSSVQQSGQKKYLIAGVFKVRENATALVIKLQSLGFANAEIIESNSLNYVSYSQVNTTEQAIALADSLRRNNFEGWVWKH
jgi:hypothetical protein